MTTRAIACETASAHVASGQFANDLAALVAHRTESQRADRADALRGYLQTALLPRLQALGFAGAVQSTPENLPILLAERVEDPALPTVLSYGHGDVVHGQAEAWTGGRDPFTLSRDGNRLYGRGSADNKGQHLINLLALQAVLITRGRLGFNIKLLIEMGEERGSPGLEAFCADHREALRADVLIASDGPRLRADRATVFTGARGALNFRLSVTARDRGRHSGNFGGVLIDPAQRLAQALATITGPDGSLRIPAWRPDSLTEDLRAVLARLPEPAHDAGWGEPGLTAAERLFGWNSFAVLAMTAGDPEAPQNAIPPRAQAHCQLRFVVGTDPAQILPELRAHLDAGGFADVEIASEDVLFPATRGRLDDPWLARVLASIQRTTGQAPDLLPNLAGSLPNHVFAELLGLPTLWIPHSYAGCNQHAPDEHILLDLSAEALALMAGVFWDIGAG